MVFFSISHVTYIARTDLAIAKLQPWRGKIPIKFFASRIRFNIRIDDLRQLVKDGRAQIDDILGFYNTATDALLNQYGTEVSAIKGSSTWKSIIVYQNMLRAIDNIGVNAAWVIKFYLKGALSNDEMVQYLRSQVSSLEYLNQAANFSPEVRRRIQAIRLTKNYMKLYAMLVESLCSISFLIDTWFDLFTAGLKLKMNIPKSILKMKSLFLLLQRTFIRHHYNI